MDARLWYDQAWDFLCSCIASSPAELDDHIREANHLFRLAPEALGISLPKPAAEKAVESMLSAGGQESAVISLLGRDTAFMVSRGFNDSNLATVVHPGRTQEFTATGSSLEFALLAAKTAALLDEAEHALGRSQKDSVTGTRRTAPEATRRQS
jgi:hypothetical protein